MTDLQFEQIFLLVQELGTQVIIAIAALAAWLGVLKNWKL